MGCGCPVARGRRGHGVPRAGKSTRDPGVKTTVLGQIGLFVKGDPWGTEAGGIPGGGSGPPADGGGRLARLRLRQVRRQARATLARGRGLTAAVWMGGRAVECTGLENRQRRKSFVGSNPTPSVLVVAGFRGLSFLSAFPGCVLSGSESVRAFAAPDSFAVSIPLGRCRCQR